MRASWQLVTPPARDILTLAEAKSQARIVQDQGDGDLRRYIQAATKAAEEHLGQGLYTQTWRLSLSDFAEIIWLPMAGQLQNAAGPPDTRPVVRYYDSDGTLQTLSSAYYTVDTYSRPAAIVRAPGQSWPALQADRLSSRVLIDYVVGWSDIADIPATILQGIRMYVTYLDADRDGMEAQAKAAREAAERCWTDIVHWKEPQCA